MKNLTKQSFIADLTQLISLKTLTRDIETNKKAIDFIVSKINPKASIKIINNNGTVSLLAGTKDTLKPDICFLVHVDIVAGKDSQFTMNIKKNIAYGRGVSDMKFSIPIGIALLNTLIEKKSTLSFTLAITTDEETGGFNGAGYLAQEYGLKPKLLLVPDGGDNFVFINKAKGVCALKIESMGKPAHSSRIWLGKNALEPIIILCNKIINKYSKNHKKPNWNTTVNIGKIEGGVSSNQVCPEAYAILDFRFPETTSAEKILSEVKKLAQSIDQGLNVSLYASGKPTYIDQKNKIVRTFIKTMESVTKKKIKINGAYGSSDARHFAHLKTPVLMIKPNGGDIHGDAEYIDIDSCLVFAQGLLNFIKQLEQNNELKKN